MKSLLIRWYTFYEWRDFHNAVFQDQGFKLTCSPGDCSSSSGPTSEMTLSYQVGGEVTVSARMTASEINAVKNHLESDSSEKGFVQTVLKRLDSSGQ